MSKPSKEKKKITKPKAGSKNWNIQILISFGLMLGIAFMQSTILLAVGMLPTGVAILIDKTKKRTLGITVGAINLAGCSPFLIDLWIRGHEMSITAQMVTDPRVIVVMYASAGMGYLINWSMVGVVESFMVKKSQKRLEDIAVRQEELVKRFGPEVTGELPLDSYGFPIDDQPTQATDE